LKKASFNDLKFDTLYEGVAKCVRNAQELCDEAEILHEHKKFARSFALSHFAREELGKSFVLSKALIDFSAGISIDWKALNRKFRDHKQKLLNDAGVTQYLFGNELAEQGHSPNTFYAIIDTKNNKKNQCLYTDWNNSKFVLPSECITEEQSERNLSLAIYRVAKFSKPMASLQNLKEIPQQKLKQLYPKEIPESAEELLNTFSKI